MRSPCRATNMPRDSVYRRLPGSQETEGLPPMTAHNQGPWPPWDMGLPPAHPGPQSHSFNLKSGRATLQRRNQNRAVRFCPRPVASKKKKKVLFQSRFLFFRVRLLRLTLCPQPRCLPFPNAPPLATLQKRKKKWLTPSPPLVFPSGAWKLEEMQIKSAAH